MTELIAAVAGLAVNGSATHFASSGGRPLRIQLFGDSWYGDARFLAAAGGAVAEAAGLGKSDTGKVLIEGAMGAGHSLLATEIVKRNAMGQLQQAQQAQAAQIQAAQAPRLAAPVAAPGAARGDYGADYGGYGGYNSPVLAGVL